MILKDELVKKDVSTLLFDIDGTITKWTSVPDFLASVLNEYGIEYQDEVLSQFFRAVTWYDMHLITTMECNYETYGYLLGESIDLLKQNGISGNDFRERMFLKEASFTESEEGIKTSMESLSKNYELYCYTNWFINQAKKKLNKYDLDKYFKHIYAYDNNYIKFTHVGFLSIMEDLGLKPNEVIHIGDSESDIIPSGRAKIQSILVDYDRNKENLYDKANAVVTEFRDIPLILERKL